MNLEEKAAAFFAKFEAAYAGFDKLYGRLDAHYKAWLEAKGSGFPPAQFGMDDDGKSAAFDSFLETLKEQKLAADLPGDCETPLWRYWGAGRPMRQEDYQRMAQHAGERRRIDDLDELARHLREKLAPCASRFVQRFRVFALAIEARDASDRVDDLADEPEDVVVAEHAAKW